MTWFIEVCVRHGSPDPADGGTKCEYGCDWKETEVVSVERVRAALNDVFFEHHISSNATRFLYERIFG